MAFPSNPSLFMSVNLSVRQFSQQDLVEKVRQILIETQLNPSHLKLEITESAVMENVGNATALLQNLRSLGVQLSMDDFGTGYSSLSYLHRFPIDTLKIDRSFVTHMTENDENAEIVRTIVGLAKNLGMDVVAEGVESQAQLEMLRQLGCEYGQGFLFSKPLAAENADSWVANIYSSPVVARLDEAEPISANWIF
jgi:EAL domain-containing protein (putative c-di-GMP-specific phosphodiesterase class I)